MTTNPNIRCPDPTCAKPILAARISLVTGTLVLIHEESRCGFAHHTPEEGLKYLRQIVEESREEVPA